MTAKKQMLHQPGGGGGQKVFGELQNGQIHFNP